MIELYHTILWNNLIKFCSKLSKLVRITYTRSTSKPKSDLGFSATCIVGLGDNIPLLSRYSQRWPRARSSCMRSRFGRNSTTRTYLSFSARPVRPAIRHGSWCVLLESKPKLVVYRHDLVWPHVNRLANIIPGGALWNTWKAWAMLNTQGSIHWRWFMKFRRAWHIFTKRVCCMAISRCSRFLNYKPITTNATPGCEHSCWRRFSLRHIRFWSERNEVGSLPHQSRTCPP
jgi:hypothetical protein